MLHDMKQKKRKTIKMMRWMVNVDPGAEISCMNYNYLKRRKDVPQAWCWTSGDIAGKKRTQTAVK